MVNSFVDDVGDVIMNKEKKGDVEGRVFSLLKGTDGLTITEIVSRTDFSRSAVRTALAKLDGAGKVYVRKIGMAKVYLPSGGKNGRR